MWGTLLIGSYVTIETDGGTYLGQVLESAPGEGVSGPSAIELGKLQRPNGVTAHLRSKGFGRHTFLCGQSGSGKTYTLGVILERLCLEGEPIVIVIDEAHNVCPQNPIDSNQALVDEDELERLSAGRWSQWSGLRSAH